MRAARTRTRGGIVSALDIGSSKMCCLIARVGADGQPMIVGVGHHVSHGVRGGLIVDLDAAETAIRSTVHTAEKMAGVTIEEVVVNLSGGRPASRLVDAETPLNGHEISQRDVRRVLHNATSSEIEVDRELIHAIPIAYSIDGQRGIRDPIGMHGARLGGNVHLISAVAGALRTLDTAVERCHLAVTGHVLSPYASALACLVTDERDLGAIVVDLGGGTTSIAVFVDGRMVFAEVVPLGGQHITSDIARGLTTTLAEAERLKTLHGSAVPGPSDDRDMIEVPLVGEGPGASHQVPRSFLVNIIQPRLEETFEHVRGALDASGFGRAVGRRVVLTGGASQLPGARELAAMVLDKQVRIGRPIHIEGLPEATSGPAFSTVAGLLGHALDDQQPATTAEAWAGPAPAGVLDRVGLWLRENF